ncbi:MAG: glycogen synthase [Solirubrobacteraceae bacterium]|nr:glycogen synthase [Solirubrobacteraceae bacterium]
MYPPHHLGGYELVWQAAVEDLRRRGHDVRVLCSDHREPGVGPGVPDEDVHRELRWYWRDHAFPRLSALRVLELERANAAVFERHLDEFSPDAVSWWAMGGMSLSLIERARRRRVPGVAFVNDDWLIYGPAVDAWLRVAGRLPRGLVERATGLPARFDPAACGRIVFASDSVRRSAAERWPLPPAEVAHGGIDPRFLAPAPPPAAWGWRLLYVGRIDPRKGIATLLEALARLPRAATLSVVGGGEAAHLGELRRLAAGLGLTDRVDFAGRRDRGELPSTYAAADAVIFPVLWDEPWGLVPLEAMACGCPVVATGTGGSAEYLRDGENCLLFTPGDAGRLAERLTRLASDPALRGRMRAGGIATAAANTDAAFNARVEAVIAEVVASG